MLPYGIVFTVISINAFLNRKETKVFNFLLFLFFIIFYSLRNEVGSDWSVYDFYFNNVQNYHIVSRFSFEPFFKFLNVFSSMILPSFRWLVFFVGIFNGYLFWNSTKKYSKNTSMIMLLSLFYMFYPTLEAFRQSITIFLFYYSLRYVEKNNKRYLLINVIGFLFHRTGLFGILFLLFHKSKLAKRIIIISMIFFYLIETYLLQLLQYIPNLYTKYIWYLNYDKVNSNILSFKIIEYILLLCVYYFYSKKEKLGSWHQINFNLLLLGAIIQGTLGQLTNIMYRVTYYSDIGIIFGYVFICDKLKQPIFKYIYIALLIIYIFLRFCRVFPYNNPVFFYKL